MKIKSSIYETNCTLLLDRIINVANEQSMYEDLLCATDVLNGSYATNREPVDLTTQVALLNALDTSFENIISRQNNVLFLGGEVTSSGGSNNSGAGTEDMDEVNEDDDVAVQSTEKDVNNIKTILNFLTALLQNAVNKDIYNSSERLVVFLRAYDDEIALLAMNAIAAFGSPPPIHKGTKQLRQSFIHLFRTDHSSCSC